MDKPHNPHQVSDFDTTEERVAKERIHDVVPGYGQHHNQQYVQPVQETQACGPHAQTHPVLRGGGQVAALQTGADRTDVDETLHLEWS